MNAFNATLESEMFEDTDSNVIDDYIYDNTDDMEADDRLLTEFRSELKGRKPINSWFSDVRVPLHWTGPLETVAFRMISENVVEPVNVTDVNSPSDFYVQLRANDNILYMVKEVLAKHANAKDSTVEIISHDKLAVYSVLTSNLQWCRCTIVDSHKENGLRLFTVHSLDYGFTEIVSQHQIREVPSELSAIPPLAFKCALHDLKPKDPKTGWSKQAYTLFCELKYAKSGTFFVYPVETRGEVMEVDLVWSDLYPLSIRNALCYFDHGSSGSYVNGVVKNELMNLITLPEPLRLDKEECHHVTVCHIVSPSEVYIRIYTTGLNELDDVMQTMQTAYNGTDKKHLIFTPQLGMTVAAKHSVDQAWYRAQIIGLPRPGSVTVFYIDFGNSETLSWNQLRILDPSLAEIPAQALRATLKGIIPANVWTPMANAALAEITTVNYNYSACLVVYVHDVTKDGEHSVTFVNYTLTTEFNVNYKLNSMGCGALLIESDDDDDDDKPVSPSNLLLARQSEYSPIEDVPAPVEDWLPARPLCVDETEVCVTHVDDRCHVYFHDLQSDAQRILSKMAADLEKIFADSRPEPIDCEWADGQMAIGKFHSDNLWYRVTILSAEDSGDCVVRFVDYGNEDTCSRDDLRAITTYNRLNTDTDYNILDIPIMCHVGYFHPILPTKEKWPKSVRNLIYKELVDIRSKISINQDFSVDNMYALMAVSTTNAPKFLDYLVWCKKAIFKFGYGGNDEEDEEDIMSSSSDYSSSVDDTRIETENLKYNRVCIKKDSLEPLDFIPVFTQLDLSAVVAEGTVTEILGPTTVVVVINRVDGADLTSAKCDMNWQLQEKCPGRVTPKFISPGTPLCVYYKCLWRRAVAIEVDPTIIVNLIDLGIVTPVENIHVKLCPADFLAIPMYAVKCQLANLEIRKDSDVNLATLVLSNVLSSGNVKIVAKEKRDDVVVAELYEQNESLGYKLLMENPYFIARTVRENHDTSY